VSLVLPRTERRREELGKSNLNMRKIVVAIDLSPRSRKTAAFAAAFAKSVGATLTFVHVFAPEPITEFTGVAADEPFEEGRYRTVAKLAKLIEEFRGTGVECYDDFRVGDPAEEIIVAAQAIEADLIIIASYHSGFLGRTLRLDQAPRIFRRATCPILVYQPKAAEIGNRQSR
jgi:nucleotide-binding universal stress UspA family protein